MEAQRSNIALVGFMGSGKSITGQRVAERLEFAFLDADGLIEAEAGKPISQIFASDGESAFRRLERGVILSLTRERHAVIATGGGAFVGAMRRRPAGYAGSSLTSRRRIATTPPPSML